MNKSLIALPLALATLSSSAQVLTPFDPSTLRPSWRQMDRIAEQRKNPWWKEIRIVASTADTRRGFWLGEQNPFEKPKFSFRAAMPLYRDQRTELLLGYAAGVRGIGIRYTFQY